MNFSFSTQIRNQIKPKNKIMPEQRIIPDNPDQCFKIKQSLNLDPSTWEEVGNVRRYVWGVGSGASCIRWTSFQSRSKTSLYTVCSGCKNAL